MTTMVESPSRAREVWHMPVLAAVALVVNGFCKDVLQALPMEFAMEAQSLVAISLEGSVG